jgi:hypothetical protein
MLGGLALAGDATAQQDPLHWVEPPVRPGAAVFRQVLPQQVAVQEGFLPLVLQVGQDSAPEEIGILVEQEEVQLMTCIL